MSERPWYRIRWQTCLLLLILCAILAWIQAIGYRRARHFGPSGNGVAIYHAGWPLVYEEHGYLNNSIVLRRLAPRWPMRLGIDIACSLVATAGVAFVVERSVRSRWQFRLSTLLVLAVVVGGVISVAPIELQFLTPAKSWGFEWYGPPHHPWDNHPTNNRLKVIATTIALGCTFFAANCLVIESIGRLRRSGV